MHWVIQNNLFDEEGFNRLLAVLSCNRSRLQGITYSIHKIVPFVGRLEPRAPSIRNRNAICFGSYSVRHTAVRNKWTPGVVDIEHATWELQTKHWGSLMLNHGAQAMYFADADLAFQNHPEMFVRPANDGKVFAGRVFTREEFLEWQIQIERISRGEDVPENGSTLRGDTRVLVATPKPILSEHRFWIVDGKIVTASTYRVGGHSWFMPTGDRRFYTFVKRVLKKWVPARAFCLDVCEVKGGDLRIVEINTMNACGFYAADLQKLVYALEEAFKVQ